MLRARPHPVAPSVCASAHPSRGAGGGASRSVRAAARGVGAWGMVVAWFGAGAHAQAPGAAAQPAGVALPVVPVAEARPAAAYRWPAIEGDTCAPGGAPAVIRLVAPGPGRPATAPSLSSAAISSLRTSAQTARQLGCLGGERLLVVADASVGQRALRGVLEAAARAGITAVDLQVQAETLRPAGAPARSALGDALGLVRREAGGFSLEHAGQRTQLGCTAGCAADDPVWSRWTAALHAAPPGTQWAWVFDDARPISELALALAHAPAGAPMVAAAPGGAIEAATPPGQAAAPFDPTSTLSAGTLTVLSLHLPSMGVAPAG